VEATEVSDQIREVVEEQHEQHVELAQERAHARLEESFRNGVAILIAALASLLAIASLGGEEASIHLLTGSILTADSYAFYQAKNIRQNLYQIAADDLQVTLQQQGGAMGPEGRQAYQKLIDGYRATIVRYESEPDKKYPDDPIKGEGKKELLARGQYWEAQRNEAELKFPNFHYAEVLFQVAIVLGSVTLITRRRWMISLTLVLGVIGIVMMMNGFFLFVELPGSH
jgi:hypothetical protein